MLRAFRQGTAKPPKRYQLVELPARIFDAIQDAPLQDFERDAPLIECRLDRSPVAYVAVDRSDAKISARRILLSACVIHAESSQA